MSPPAVTAYPVVTLSGIKPYFLPFVDAELNRGFLTHVRDSSTGPIVKKHRRDSYHALLACIASLQAIELLSSSFLMLRNPHVCLAWLAQRISRYWHQRPPVLPGGLLSCSLIIFDMSGIVTLQRESVAALKCDTVHVLLSPDRMNSACDTSHCTGE